MHGYNRIVWICNKGPEWLAIHLNMCLSSGCDGVLVGVMTWIHIMCMVAMLKFRVTITWIKFVFSIEDIQCIVGRNDMVIIHGFPVYWYASMFESSSW